MIIDVNCWKERFSFIVYTAATLLPSVNGAEKYKWLDNLRIHLLSLKKKNGHIWKEYKIHLEKNKFIGLEKN